VEQLEGLVVARLFELSKANLSHGISGYKLQQHISNAITKRSLAIRTALDKYNELAPLQRPPRPTLEYSEIASYGWLGEFELLKHSHHDILSKPWASKANREIATKYFKIVRAREEITRLNVEIGRLHAWIDYEDVHLFSTGEADDSDPHLAHEIHHRCKAQRCVNNVHRVTLQAIYNLPGFSGTVRPVDVPDAALVLSELEGHSAIQVDEDDTLCDEANRLEACISE
ncbi:hypothetical protein HYDPIDRAFT_97749, partial [Hydnomerulius pinastri MD-312]